MPDSITEYVKNQQIIIDLWKNRFECLFDWTIRFVYDGEHWSSSRYDLNQQKAIIYPCDVQDEEAWLIHEVIKLAMIVSDRDSNMKLELVANLVAILQGEYRE